MWLQDPESRLAMINQRGLELRAEAAANRAAARTSDCNRFSGLRIQLGSFLLVIGRTLADDKASPRPIQF
jgi:hypothetical protein